MRLMIHNQIHMNSRNRVHGSIFLQLIIRLTCSEGLTEADVRLQLAQEEAEQVIRGIPAIHDVTLSAFILAGLELEELQYV
jgi:hypothetical protein